MRFNPTSSNTAGSFTTGSGQVHGGRNPMYLGGVVTLGIACGFGAGPMFWHPTTSLLPQTGSTIPVREGQDAPPIGRRDV